MHTSLVLLVRFLRVPQSQYRFSITKNRQFLHRKVRMRFFSQSFQPRSYLSHHIPPHRNYTVPYLTKLQAFCICLQVKEMFGHPSFCLWETVRGFFFFFYPSRTWYETLIAHTSSCLLPCPVQTAVPNRKRLPQKTTKTSFSPQCQTLTTTPSQQQPKHKQSILQQTKHK